MLFSRNRLAVRSKACSPRIAVATHRSAAAAITTKATIKDHPQASSGTDADDTSKGSQPESDTSPSKPSKTSQNGSGDEQPPKEKRNARSREKRRKRLAQAQQKHRRRTSLIEAIGKAIGRAVQRTLSPTESTSAPGEKLQFVATPSTDLPPLIDLARPFMDQGPYGPANKPETVRELPIPDPEMPEAAGGHWPSIRDAMNDRELVVDAHITLPDMATRRSEKLPVVFIFNAFALGLQRCSWYFDYAAHLASFGYAVIQFEDLDRLSFVDGTFTEAAVEYLLSYYEEQGKPIDRSRIAFVGHSKGGSDALWMLDQQESDVTAAAFLLDGVIGDETLGTGVQPDWDLPPGSHVALSRASITSAFNLDFGPIQLVDKLRQAANDGAPGRVVAARVSNTGHFSFVAPENARRIRSVLKWPGLRVAVSPALLALALWRVGHGAWWIETLFELLLAAAPWLLILDTDRPWDEGTGEERSGNIYSPGSGLMVAWMEGTFRKDGLLDEYLPKREAQWDEQSW